MRGSEPETRNAQPATIQHSLKARHLKFITLSTLTLFLFAACKNKGGLQASTDSANASNSVPADSGWVNLFDGQSLAGWHSYGKSVPGNAWKVDSNAIHLIFPENSKKDDGGDLTTDHEYGNFELKLDWKIVKKGNSGIIFYVKEDTSKYRWTWNTGMEMQVCDKDSNEDAHNPKHQAGDLYDLIAANPPSAKGPGEWNLVEIHSNNGELDMYLNGVHIISTTLWDDRWNQLISGSKFKTMPGFGTFKAGKIALQDHGDEAWYRNIRIKKL